MQITCPNCGARVGSEQINIQKMAAVCPACDTVFNFEVPSDKPKRRKVKRPEKLTVNEVDDGVAMNFRTNFRLDQDENLYAWLTGVVTSLFFSVYLVGGALGEAIAGNFEPTLTLFSILVLPVFIGCLYGLALHVFNKTHIDMDHEHITVSRQPLANPLSPPVDIDLNGVEVIRYEETPASVENGYDTPRYNVWAQTMSSTRKMIVTDVVEDYAVFIAQRLNEALDAQRTPVLDDIDDADYDVLEVDDVLFDGELRSDSL